MENLLLYLNKRLPSKQITVWSTPIPYIYLNKENVIIYHSVSQEDLIELEKIADEVYLLIVLSESDLAKNQADFRGKNQKYYIYIYGDICKVPVVAPSDFEALAIMSVFNEEDIVKESVTHLLDNNCSVYVIDNNSTDKTSVILNSMQLQYPNLRVERYPNKPSKSFNLIEILEKVESVAKSSSADWIIHYDADELRSSPWKSSNLRDSLYRVYESGYDAVDHTVLEFGAIHEEGTPLKEYRYGEWSKRPGHFKQVKSWRNGSEIHLAQTAGHRALDANIFPIKFLTCHYPIRSQIHGDKKIFQDRHPRWNKLERDRGWHVHYDEIKIGHEFVKDIENPVDIKSSKWAEEYLLERLFGLGIVDRNLAF